MTKRRTTRPKGPKFISEQEDHATSPPTDIESNPSMLATDLTSKPRPKPRPKSAKQAIAPSTPDAVDEVPHQHPKRGRSRSDTDGTVPASIVQPPAKKTKVSNSISPADDNIGNSHSKTMPRRSPLPLRINRVVNPGAPDKKRTKRTSAEVAAAAQQKRNLRLELEKMERDKIRMLAEMEAVEEEEQREEERMGIKDIADLAESHADSETETRYSTGDNDIIMADHGEDHEEVDDAFVEVDSEPELEQPGTVKTVSESMQLEDNECFVDDWRRCTLQ
jgi:hypothetical protein